MLCNWLIGTQGCSFAVGRDDSPSPFQGFAVVGDGSSADLSPAATFLSPFGAFGQPSGAPIRRRLGGRASAGLWQGLPGLQYHGSIPLGVFQGPAAVAALRQIVAFRRPTHVPRFHTVLSPWTSR